MCVGKHDLGQWRVLRHIPIIVYYIYKNKRSVFVIWKTHTKNQNYFVLCVYSTVIANNFIYIISCVYFFYTCRDFVAPSVLISTNTSQNMMMAITHAWMFAFGMEQMNRMRISTLKISYFSDFLTLSK